MSLFDAVFWRIAWTWKKTNRNSSWKEIIRCLITLLIPDTRLPPRFVRQGSPVSPKSRLSPWFLPFLLLFLALSVISQGIEWLHRKIVFVLVNVAVQLDRETQRHPCFNTPRGRGDQTGGIMSSSLQRWLLCCRKLTGWQSWRYNIQKQGKMYRAGILQSLHGKSKTPKNAKKCKKKKRKKKDNWRTYTR